FPQELPKEDPTKIIAYISRDVNLTNQVEKALAVFEERCNYLKPVKKPFIDNVYEFKDLLGKRDVWYIVDSRKPTEFHAKMIIVCSPQKRYYLTFDNLGTVVRYVTVWYRAEIEKIILDFVGETTDDNSSSCRLVHIRTNVPQVYRRKNFLSYVFGEVIDKFTIHHRNNQLLDFVKNSSLISEYSTLRGTIFERIAHRKLPSRESFRTHPLFDKLSPALGTDLHTNTWRNTVVQRRSLWTSRLKQYVLELGNCKENGSDLENIAHLYEEACNAEDESDQ
ncbi:18838_t:CDS:2, partial [Entrophospora sp. SA101]